MTILFAASEMVPFCKTGGLADVIGALTPVLAGMGHSVHVMLPGYKTIERARYGFTRGGGSIEIPVGTQTRFETVSTADWNGVKVHLLENDDYFGREGLYGDADGDYADNGSRFIFFSRAVLIVAKHLGIKPDIIHTHDWQSGLVMSYLATVYRDDPFFAHTGKLFTIHNLGYQGLFPREVFALSGIPEEEYRWTKLEFFDKVSFIKGGIVYADAVSTVSETYAEEITGKELGFGLDGLFRERRDDLYGIVNGIDNETWNPAADRIIPERYTSDDLTGKTACRSELLSLCGQKAAFDEMVIGIVSRLDDQKGFDILEEASGRLINLNIRLIILGTGTRKHHKTMKDLAARYPKKISVMLKFDNDTAHLIYAGADAFLMPSRYEPCGLGQLIAMRYGALPIVHATGGLADTVRDLDSYPGGGTGFSFSDYTPEVLMEAVFRAQKVFRSRGRKRWTEAVKRAMEQDYSWEKSARKYLEIYKRININIRTRNHTQC